MSRSHPFRFVAVLASVIVLGLTGLSQAHAQVVVKRIKCKDAVLPHGTAPDFYHVNDLAYTVKITVQVVRDGCRPKLTDGRFQLDTRSFGGGGGSAALLYRYGRQTISRTTSLNANSRAYIRFIPITGAKVSGTFDYFYSID